MRNRAGGEPMPILRSVDALQQWRAGATGTVGFVPTMGALHDGHLALIRRAASENDHAVTSVFVNPTQFGEAQDLAAYPRVLERDAALAEEAGSDILFAPEAGDIYPTGFQTWVEVQNVSQPLEGAARPGHFRGVATVVLKLLNLVNPHRAYFGRKDAQQLAVVTAMVRDLDVPVTIVPCDTVREPDGLAMSSRNARLSPTERRVAPVIHLALLAARDRWQSGERAGDALRAAMRRVLDAEPLLALEYASVADASTLRELDQVDAGALVSIAARLGSTRLIDNLTLEDAPL